MILIFSVRNPGTVRVSAENSKAAAILARCTILGPQLPFIGLRRWLEASVSISKVGS
jgi:hypothetical protein